MKLSSENLQILLYFWNEKTQIVSFFILSNFGFVTVDALVYVAQNEKQTKKNLFWFSYSKNVAYFEAFCQTISSSINILFLNSDICILVKLLIPIYNIKISKKIFSLPEVQLYSRHIKQPNLSNFISLQNDRPYIFPSN